MKALHFTLEQVSRELDLPIGVVRQLSRQFEVPKNYYRPLPGQPRLMLFDAAEVSMLEHIQSLIQAGHSWSEIKTWSQTFAPAHAPVPARAMPQPSAWAEDVSSENLPSYQDDAAMNKYLAETTFGEYRFKTRPAAKPMASVVERLQPTTVNKPALPPAPPPQNLFPEDFNESDYEEYDEDAEEYFSVPHVAAMSKPPVSYKQATAAIPDTQIIEQETFAPAPPQPHPYFADLVPSIPVSQPEPLMPQSPWVTESLKQRARRLQLELLSHSHNT